MNFRMALCALTKRIRLVPLVAAFFFLSSAITYAEVIELQHWNAIAMSINSNTYAAYDSNTQELTHLFEMYALGLDWGINWFMIGFTLFTSRMEMVTTTYGSKTVVTPLRHLYLLPVRLSFPLLLFNKPQEETDETNIFGLFLKEEITFVEFSVTSTTNTFDNLFSFMLNSDTKVFFNLPMMFSMGTPSAYIGFNVDFGSAIKTQIYAGVEVELGLFTGVKVE